MLYWSKRLFIIPSTATRESDVFEVNRAIERAIEHKARRHFEAVKHQNPELNQGGCLRCGRDGKTELHHARPVWVFCLELIVSRRLYKLGEASATQEEFDFSELNSDDNLIRLCSACHRQEEPKTKKFWLKALEQGDPSIIFLSPHFPISRKSGRLWVKLRQNQMKRKQDKAA